MTSVPTPVRKFRAFGSRGIYDEGITRAGVYFELLRRRGVSLTEGALLDVGSSFGGFSIQAARDGARVTAIDGDEYRLRVLRERLSIEPACVRARISALKADAPHLPFESCSFDRVMSIGVIEWVPLLSSQHGEPTAVQTQTLTEIRRVLKPGGTYVLATKNRWYPIHLWREPNTGWPLVDWLPRGLAQGVAEAVWHQGYRTYNHSARGWKTMLRAAGFRSTRVLVPIYGMHWPLELVPAGNGGVCVAQTESNASQWIPPGYLQRTQGGWANLKQTATQAVWTAGLEQVLGQGFVFIATA